MICSRFSRLTSDHLSFFHSSDISQLFCSYNLIIQIFYQMKTFRKKYIYNPDNPRYESPNVRTYNCMNTETKEKNLIILQHLTEPPFVEPSPTILQPLEIPTTSDPFSVYPIVRCVSEIGKLAEPEAMYIIKCITESKIKKPLYCVISKQGIVTCNVEGILPDKTPDLFKLSIDWLDLPSNLAQVEKSVVSKQGYSICRAIRQNDMDSVKSSLNHYGWKDIKKQKQNVTDEQFIVFKGRRKEEGSIMNEQYGLAWSNTHGMCKMKFINLSRDGYEEQFYKDFVTLMELIQEKKSKQKIPFLDVYKYSKDYKGITIFSQLADQGSLSQYILKKHEAEKTLNQKNTLGILEKFIQEMAVFSRTYMAKGTAVMHIKQLYVHRNRLMIGEPFLITDKAQKKFRDLKSNMDYYAPEFKENIILQENLAKLDKEKMDIWSFGFILHKIYARQVPMFDASRKPILNKGISMSMASFINECLALKEEDRPRWAQIKLRDIEKRSIKIQEVKQEPIEKEEIRLGSRVQRSSEKVRSAQKKRRVIEQLEQEDKADNQEQLINEKLKVLDDEQEELELPIPMQISSRLKKIKLILKIIVIMCLYIFVFFRPFFANSIDILTFRSFYTTTTLHLVNYQNERQSSTTVLTHDPIFFLQNDISFAQVHDEYYCIDDNFDPINNPDYSLLTYIQSSSFLAMLLTGWLMAIIICVVKAISIWRGGISNRPNKGLCQYWLIYGFHELSLAALLFSHFYVYQFFYFSGAEPCLSINNYSNLQPFFDSTLYLFLSNVDGYFQQVFSTLGVLSIFLLISCFFYALAPKQDQKYFISIPSILFRIVPFILLLLICRIGVFNLFAPTAINDETGILPAIVNNSIEGFLGIIPEVFIMVCVFVQVLLELFMSWCESKAAQNDRLARLFNIKKRKMEIDESEQKNYEKINDMSIVNNSKHKLDISSLDH